MADIFRKTRRDREEAAGLSEKPPEKKKESEQPQMTQADFLYGYKRKDGGDRPPMSKKWVEK